MLPFDLVNFCRECNVSNTDEFVAKTSRLYLLLREANRNVNLTRIRSEDDYWIKHVADSLSIAKFFPALSREKLEIADVGCGAGFPSLVLAAAFPELSINAIDSIEKKAAFVRGAANELGLGNITVITGRSRELNRKTEYIERFDIVTARAVSDLRTLFRESGKLIKAGGKFIFFKTPEQTATELPQVRMDSRKHPVAWEKTEIFFLPCDSGKRLFVYSV